MVLYKKNRRDASPKGDTQHKTPFEPIVQSAEEVYKKTVYNLPELLATGLTEMGLKLSAPQQQQLLSYVELIIHWNRAYNLTSVRDPQDIVIRHILDSLSTVPYIQGDHIVDVGSGAGLPGIPLAICFPDKQLTLIDSNGKKARFLATVTGVNERVEGFQKSHVLNEVHQFQKFDTVISRAYTSIRDMLFATEHLCSQQGIFIAMKGVYPVTEIDELPEEFRLVKSHAVTVPHLFAERHVLILNMCAP
jgi:16S rRNA (guanine527-N7)-methyltransferase